MDLIFFGMQGAGKGTLGKTVASQFGLDIFETGGELRRLASEDSELGQKIKSIIEAGELVSNEVVMEIVENFVNNREGDSPILFDGIPRSVEQAQTLNSLLDKHDRKYKAVLLEIKKETALTRLTTRRLCPVDKHIYPASYKSDTCECGTKLVTRKDDNPEAIEKRLDLFAQETQPAIDLYSDKLIKIDGELSIEEVNQNAIESLKELF
jgi:adenylate kinase